MHDTIPNSHIYAYMQLCHCTQNADFMDVTVLYAYLHYTFSYKLRIQGMQLQLEFEEKKAELKPALETFHQAIDGNAQKHIASLNMLCWHTQKYLYLNHSRKFSTSS